MVLPHIASPDDFNGFGGHDQLHGISCCWLLSLVPLSTTAMATVAIVLTIIFSKRRVSPCFDVLLRERQAVRTFEAAAAEFHPAFGDSK